MRLQLRIQQLPVDSHFKASAIRWHERHPFDRMLVILEQFFCQAHGPTQIVSDRAIDNFYFEHKPSAMLKGLYH